MRRTKPWISSTAISTNTPTTSLRSAKGALQPHELLRAFVRYKHVDYYDPTLFGRTYDWMKSGD